MINPNTKFQGEVSSNQKDMRSNSSQRFIQKPPTSQYKSQRTGQPLHSAKGPAENLYTNQLTKQVKGQRGLSRHNSAKSMHKKENLFTEMMGFPKIDDIGYLNMKAKEDLHKDCLNGRCETKSKAFIEL